MQRMMDRYGTNLGIGDSRGVALKRYSHAFPPHYTPDLG